MPTDSVPWPSSISLRAMDPARNIARHYQIDISTDLFGLWVVDYRWGRIGTAGQVRRASFIGADDAQDFVRRLVRRRAGAKRRIGVPYQWMNVGAEGRFELSLTNSCRKVLPMRGDSYASGKASLWRRPHDRHVEGTTRNSTLMMVGVEAKADDKSGTTR